MTEPVIKNILLTVPLSLEVITKYPLADVVVLSSHVLYQEVKLFELKSVSSIKI